MNLFPTHLPSGQEIEFIFTTKMRSDATRVKERLTKCFFYY